MLATDGGLPLLWNETRWEQSGLPWLPAFETLTEPLREEAGQFPADAEEWRAALAATGLFTPVVAATWSWVYEITADDFVVLVGFWSWIANLARARRRAVLARVRELLGDGDRPLRLDYCTETYWAHARDDHGAS